jgi:alanyl-tRNA synthetase
MIENGETILSANPGDFVAVITPKTGFYVESGGQVSDTGLIQSANLDDGGKAQWEIRILDMRKPAAGVLIHIGQVLKGHPKVGDQAIVQVDAARRQDIMRNHTATHLLHAELRVVLGEHVRQAGSLVAPDRLRFDFTHPQAVSAEEIERIESGVNRAVLGDHALNIRYKPLQQAISEGAMALFGEKYSETVRTITIGDEEPFSYELCGGTHVEETGDIGTFIITSEGSVAAGIRRIEAVTGSGAYELIQRRFQTLKRAANLLAATPDDLLVKTSNLLDELDQSHKRIAALRQELAASEFVQHLQQTSPVKGVAVLASLLSETDADTLRLMTDRFRQQYPSGVVVLGTVSQDGRPLVVAAISDDLVKRGLHAGELVKFVAGPLGGGGGGRPTLAQAGGKDASKLPQALESVPGWVDSNLK